MSISKIQDVCAPSRAYAFGAPLSFAECARFFKRLTFHWEKVKKEENKINRVLCSLPNTKKKTITLLSSMTTITPFLKTLSLTLLILLMIAADGNEIKRGLRQNIPKQSLQDIDDEEKYLPRNVLHSSPRNERSLPFSFFQKKE